MAAPDAPLSDERARAIAGAFAPQQGFRQHWDYHYSLAKLRSDPLYPGVCEALRDSTLPLLDLGCGLGLLAHALRADGIALRYRGVDNDANKIAGALRASHRQGLADASFECIDLANTLPDHHGSVAILDVLQFLAPDDQQRTLEAAIAMLVPGARLVIRTGLDDGSRRARVTRAVDVFSRVIGWMNAGPRSYPDPEGLQQRFDAAGLITRFTPLYGNTPFNNWLVVATAPGQRPPSAPAR